MSEKKIIQSSQEMVLRLVELESKYLKEYVSAIDASNLPKNQITDSARIQAEQAAQISLGILSAVEYIGQIKQRTIGDALEELATEIQEAKELIEWAKDNNIYNKLIPSPTDLKNITEK